MIPKLIILFLMVAFYAAYILKTVFQHRKGVTTLVLGKGDNKAVKEKKIEQCLLLVTVILPLVQVLSVFWNLMALPLWWQLLGALVSALGVLFFLLGMLTMKGSWRAGIPEDGKTELVTGGIYRLSRNPAFLGFNLFYFGVLMAFPNAYHACLVAAAAYLLHQQILGEERYLERTFGSEYLEYKRCVRRYL